MKELNGKALQHGSTLPCKIILDNKTTTDERDIAERINKFFSVTGLSLAN